ncbi:MAG: PKD domain-containing protein [Thermoplasmatales archaeon]|nr:PKD domain-containing protein [Thermoplasmatales archaeon]
MKIKIFITLFTVLILVSSFFVSASSVKITNFDVNSSSLSEAELPDWAIGNYWKYNMNFDFIARDDGSVTFSVDAEISNMYATVTSIVVKDNEDVYILTIDGWIEGVISLFETEWEIADFEGDFGGAADISRNTLGIREFNFEVDGQIDIPLLGWRDMYFDMKMTFDPGFDFFDFPIVEGEGPWDVQIEEAVLDAYFFVDLIIDIEKDYTGSMAFSDVMSLDRIETVSVPAGDFNSFVLSGTWGSESRLWYAPDIGYLAKVEETLNWDDGAVGTVFHLDLLDTNYDAGNDPPYPPDKPYGPTTGEVEIDYTFSTQTDDPQGDQVYYWIDWGDGTNSGWLGPYNSGVAAYKDHRWYCKGVYSIVAKAKDSVGVESGWSEPSSIMIMGVPKVTLLMHHIEKKDEIDNWAWPNSLEPEWYYMCHAKTEQGSPEQYNYNKDGNGDWISSNSWNPEEEHVFEVADRYPLIKIKLMDHDGLNEGGSDDLADVSGCNHPDNDGYDNGTPDKRGAIYHGTYDVVNEELKAYDPDPNENADYVYKESGYYITCGDYEPDSSTEYENGVSAPQNDALVSFRLTNDYNFPQANAQLLEPPEKRRPFEELLFIGTVKEGTPDYSWNWNFGDGETSNEQSPIHVFEDKGIYTVILTVTDGFGQVDSHSIQVEIRNDNPILLNDKVDWTGSGSLADVFTFSVHYIDPDMDIPTVKKVFIDGTGKSMHGQGSNAVYNFGLYGYEMGSGNHKFYFYFEDGHGGSTKTTEKTFNVKKSRSVSIDRFSFLANLLDHFPILMKLIQIYKF